MTSESTAGAPSAATSMPAGSTGASWPPAWEAANTPRPSVFVPAAAAGGAPASSRAPSVASAAPTVEGAATDASTAAGSRARSRSSERERERIRRGATEAPQARPRSFASPVSGAGFFFRDMFSASGLFSGGASAAAASVGPPPSQDAAWLQRAMHASLATLGEHIEQRVSAVELGARQAGERADAAAAAAARAQLVGEGAHHLAEAAVARASDVSAGMQDLRDQLQRLQLEVREAATRPSPAGEADAHVARIANLGWDADETVLLERARAVLTAAQVQDTDLVALSAAVGRSRLGSACEAVFASRARRLRRGRMRRRTQENVRLFAGACGREPVLRVVLVMCMARMLHVVVGLRARLRRAPQCTPARRLHRRGLHLPRLLVPFV